MKTLSFKGMVEETSYFSQLVKDMKIRMIFKDYPELDKKEWL